jgi:hypothetical protein
MRRWLVMLPVLALAAPAGAQPAQPTLQDQIYMIARAQEKQIEILQAELQKTRSDAEYWRNWAGFGPSAQTSEAR